MLQAASRAATSAGLCVAFALACARPYAPEASASPDELVRLEVILHSRPGPRAATTDYTMHLYDAERRCPVELGLRSRDYSGTVQLEDGQPQQLQVPHGRHVGVQLDARESSPAGFLNVCRTSGWFVPKAGDEYILRIHIGARSCQASLFEVFSNEAVSLYAVDDC